MERKKMQCPKCQFENREEAQFCSECGHKFELICPECGTNIRTGSKFCDGCGSNLELAKETSTEISGINTLPFQSTDEQASPDVAAIVGERKHVTVLFSDLIGYTTMSERLDPEDVKDITAQIFDDVSKIVAKYDGFIEKFAGDAVMALFGATKAHEDDPVRAIHAAREIHNLVNSLSPKYEEKIEHPLSMHTGINTGLVVTGEINLEKGTHGVAGDTINVAARLSDLGKADEILVGYDTYKQAEGYFDFEELEPVEIKGKGELIKAYKFSKTKDEPVKIHRLHGLQADLIGRKVEMKQLTDAVQKLKDGKGTVFSIFGTAGTGKSRLVQEFKSTLNLNDIQWYEGNAYPYSQGIPYYPLVDLLNRTLQIEEGDPPEQIKNKIESGLENIIGKDQDVIPFIGSLYSLNYPEIEEVSPEFWKIQLQKAVQIILSAISRQGPTIICLEDLHWADPSFLELIRLLLIEFQDPVLFLCVYRPLISLLSGHQIDTITNQYQEIRLVDLSPSESHVMVGSLLKTDKIPSDLQRFVQDKVEGNPFYIEEVINSLIESGSLVRDNGDWKVTRSITESEISSTIHGVISGRLDRLEKETKRILQEASVIGRTFFYEILNRVTEIEDQMDQCLRILERLDLIRTRSLHPDLEYIFKHALTQEVVYNGLLKKERKIIHERIGMVMEQLFHDRLPEFYETLAFHFQQGHSRIKAVDYLIRSGEKSLKRFALDESHKYYKEAFKILTDIPDKSLEEKKLLVDLIIKWALIFYYRCEAEDWRELFSFHLHLAESIDDPERLAMCYAWLGFGCVGFDNKKSIKLLHRALEIGEELNNQKIIGYACTWLTWTCSDLGLFDEAVQHGMRAIKISKIVESDHYLFFKAVGGLSLAYWQKGEPKRVFKIGNELLDHGKKYAHIRSQTMGHIALGGAHISIGNQSMGIKCLQKAYEVSADIMYDTCAKIWLSMGYLLNNQIEEAEAHMKESLKFCNEVRFSWAGMPGQLFYGVILIAKGNMRQGFTMIQDAHNHFIKEERKYYIAVAEHTIGKIYAQIVEGTGPINLLTIAKNIGFLMKNVPFADKKAESHFIKAIEIAKEIGAKSVLGPAYLDLGLLHKAKKRYKQAKVYILKAMSIFEDWEAGIYLKQAKEALKNLE
jgi:class 3 adenylate cyclase/tetratricopeptide (TPR) repeat protein